MPKDVRQEWRLVVLLTVSLLAFLLALREADAATRPEGSPRFREAQESQDRSRHHLRVAIQRFREALQENPEDLEVQRGLADALEAAGDVQEAAPLWREIARRTDEGADHARLGWTLLRAGQTEATTDAFAAARQRGWSGPPVDLTPEVDSGSPSAPDSEGEPPPGSQWLASLLRSVPEVPMPPPSPTRAIAEVIGSFASLAKRLLNWGAILLPILGLALFVWSRTRRRILANAQPGLRMTRLQDLPVSESGSGRGLGHVRRVLYDPARQRVVGIQTGHWWRWRVAPWSAVCGMWEKGLVLADAKALTRGEGAPELSRLAREHQHPLGRGADRKQVIQGSGAVLGTVRRERVWVTGDGEVWVEVTPQQWHVVWRVAVSVLEFGPICWLKDWLHDQGVETLPAGMALPLCLPAQVIEATDREAVFVTEEAAEQIDRHCEELQANARRRVDRVRATGANLAHRSAQVVRTQGRRRRPGADVRASASASANTEPAQEPPREE